MAPALDRLPHRGPTLARFVGTEGLELITSRLSQVAFCWKKKPDRLVPIASGTPHLLVPTVDRLGEAGMNDCPDFTVVDPDSEGRRRNNDVDGAVAFRRTQSAEHVVAKVTRRFTGHDSEATESMVLQLP